MGLHLGSLLLQPHILDKAENFDQVQPLKLLCVAKKLVCLSLASFTWSNRIFVIKQGAYL
jgi:hypothetical protein